MIAPETLKKFRRIFIHEDSRDSQLARNLVSWASEKIEWVTEKPLLERQGQLSADEFQESKNLLYVTPFRGSFFKRCPGAKKGLACCNYYVLNLGLQCDMNCSYCYLQSYINTPLMTMYSNLDVALGELKEMAEEFGSSPFRVGTGETIDSLSLDEITLYSRQLIEFFNQYPKWRLEFKTKSAKVDQFLDVPTIGNTIVSWSINPQYIIEKEEHLTASLDERLSAAEKCLHHGYSIAFHIDPMIYFDGWKEEYQKLIDEVSSRFKPTDMPYISLGALRFQPEQKSMMRERFGMKSLVNRAEMHQGADGKMRYDKSLRHEMFQFVIDGFKQKDPQWKIFLCMETPETWAATFDSAPVRVDGLQELFKALPQKSKELVESV